MSQLSTFFPTVTAASLGLGNSANVTFGSVTTSAVTASGPLSGAGFTNRFAAPGPIGSTTPSTGAFTTLAANNGTITASAPVLDLAQTWNNAAVTFTGMRFNVTNTASAAASLIADFQVGGTSIVNINRDGFIGSANAGINVRATGSLNRLSLFSQGATRLLHNNNILLSESDGGYGWVTSGAPTSLSFDTGIFRGAAGTIDQRNGANAQAYRLYNTTDAGLTNFERGFMRWSSNVLQIGTEAGGTGSARALEFQTGGTTRATLNTAGTLALNNGTVTTSTPALTVTQTLNSTGTTFRLVDLSFTSTASSTNSEYISCSTGGVGNFSVRRDGTVLATTYLSSNGFRAIGGGNGGGQVILSSNGAFIFNDSTTSTFGTQDLFLRRDAAGVFAQYNGVNAQAYRLYNTVSGTGNVNFERANFRWASSEFIIDVEAGGTGTLRGIKIGSATSSLLGFYGATPVDRPATVADPTGGGTIDTEARTAINDIIDRLQELGLIA